MILRRLLSITAAVILMCAALTGCTDKSSSSSEDAGNSSSSSSASESSSGTSSSSSQDSSASSGDSSQVKKVNAVGYDVKGSKRLYDTLKSNYSSKGYKITLSHANNAGATIVINKKGNKLYSSNANINSSTAVLYTGDKKSTMFDFRGLRYQEKAVDDEAKFLANQDLLFGMTGNFIKAQIDEASDTIVETYKVNKDVAGQDGQIGFCFRGSDASFCEIFILYDGDDMAQYFGVKEITEASENLFKMPDIKGYTKLQ